MPTLEQRAETFLMNSTNPVAKQLVRELLVVLAESKIAEYPTGQKDHAALLAKALIADKPICKRASANRTACPFVEPGRPDLWCLHCVRREAAAALTSPPAERAPERDHAALLAHLPWALERIKSMADIAERNASVHGVKLLKGHGYPDEVMSWAQDALALQTILAALSTGQPEGEQTARRKLHIAFNVAARRAGASGLPACAGPECEICAALTSPPAERAPERDHAALLAEKLTLAKNYIREMRDRAERLKVANTLGAIVALADSVLPELEAALTSPPAERAPVDGVEIVVNGQPVTVTAGPIRNVIAAAIAQSGQIGAPIEQWVLRTREGDVIPHELPGGAEYALTAGQRFFLHLGLPVPSPASAPITEQPDPSPPAERAE